METNDLSFIRSLLEGAVNQHINKGPIAISHHFLAFVDKLYLNKLAACEVSDDVIGTMISLKNEIESINQKVQHSRYVAITRKEGCKKYAAGAREIVEDAMCQYEADDERNGDGESEDEADDAWEEEELPTRSTRSKSTNKGKTSRKASSKMKNKKKTAKKTG